ncbi:MAG TPA: FKBP-type peptidyl-prolyl cis-trans isomerase, partial [Chitinophagales bacterium]|nr:FKBP-type peptidyl-prolyl cis-trans isomerase [Chitinophagales bacterium]
GARNKYYYYELLLLDVRGKSDYQREKEVQIQQQQTLDSLAILAYLQKNDIRASAVDDQGLWYSRRSFGAGENVQSGDTVTLHYIGKLTNEVEFDNSYERNQPFTFVVGTKQVIEGLDKGIRHFFYGDTGMLIIPSRWAYGSRETGRIPANAVLVFEFQIMEKNP